MEQSKWYEHNGKLYPRVSSILNVVNWGIVPRSETYRKRRATEGTNFHKLVHEMVSVGKPAEVSVKYNKRLNTIEQWLKDYEVVKSEERVFWDSPTEDLRYAGQIDLLLKDKTTGLYSLDDIKTGKAYKRHELQLSAYAEAIEQTLSIPVTKMRLIRPVGDTIEEYTLNRDFSKFLNILRVYYDKCEMDGELEK